MKEEDAIVTARRFAARRKAGEWSVRGFVIALVSIPLALSLITFALFLSELFWIPIAILSVVAAFGVVVHLISNRHIDSADAVEAKEYIEWMRKVRENEDTYEMEQARQSEIEAEAQAPQSAEKLEQELDNETSQEKQDSDEENVEVQEPQKVSAVKN